VTSPPDPGDAVLPVVEHLLTRNREEIGRADTKASILAGGVLAITGLVAANRPEAVPAGAGRVLLVLGTVAWGAAAVFLAAAIFPRLRVPGPGRALTYLGGPLDFTDATQLRRYVEVASADRMSWLLVQVADTHRIVVAKFRCIRIALYLLGAGAGLTAAGLVF
jgi:hypothetical protein